MKALSLLAIVLICLGTVNLFWPNLGHDTPCTKVVTTEQVSPSLTPAPTESRRDYFKQELGPAGTIIAGISLIHTGVSVVEAIFVETKKTSTDEEAHVTHDRSDTDPITEIRWKKGESRQIESELITTVAWVITYEGMEGENFKFKITRIR